MINNNTIDITFTFDLEDHRTDSSLEKTYPEYTRMILDFLDECSAKATFFIVGNIAEDEPNLIKQISVKGHEIAFHSHSHRILDKESPNEFKQNTLDYKNRIEDITGKEISGYRAPVFSLKENTLWVLGYLQELGFKYSSSIIPGNTVLHGFPDTPRQPFYWPNGMLEIPVPVISFSRFSLPYLGGFYLRYLPKSLIRNLIYRNQNQTLWMYCHPYDFASDEPYFRMKNTSHLISLLLWFNRNNTINKIRGIIQAPAIQLSGKTFRQQLDEGKFSESPGFSANLSG